MSATVKWKQGELIFLQSTRPAVFAPRTVIRWVIDPKKGQAFLFMRPGDATPSNTSTVQKVTRFNGGVVLETRNSLYVVLVDADAA